MKPQQLPLIVLGGSDCTPSVMPRDSGDQHPLSGYKVFQIAYTTRNRPIDQRRNVMLHKLVLGLLAEDLRSLVVFRPPTLAWTLIRAGVVAVGELRRGTMTRARLEDALRILFVKKRHRREFPERRVVLPIIDDLSIAMDVDTEEEARELTARLDHGWFHPPA